MTTQILYFFNIYHAIPTARSKSLHGTSMLFMKPIHLLSDVSGFVPQILEIY